MPLLKDRTYPGMQSPFAGLAERVQDAVYQAAQDAAWKARRPAKRKLPRRTPGANLPVCAAADAGKDVTSTELVALADMTQADWDALATNDQPLVTTWRRVSPGYYVFADSLGPARYVVRGDVPHPVVARVRKVDPKAWYVVDLVNRSPIGALRTLAEAKAAAENDYHNGI